jgi:hypothetical protein
MEDPSARALTQVPGLERAMNRVHLAVRLAELSTVHSAEYYSPCWWLVTFSTASGDIPPCSQAAHVRQSI